MQRFLIYLFLKMLYMFRTVLPPIIRSTKVYNTAFRYCEPILLLAASVDEMVLIATSHPRQQLAAVLVDNT